MSALNRILFPQNAEAAESFEKSDRMFRHRFEEFELTLTEVAKLRFVFRGSSTLLEGGRIAGDGADLFLKALHLARKEELDVDFSRKLDAIITCGIAAKASGTPLFIFFQS